MYVWQVGGLDKVSFITDNECIVTYRVPNIHESPFIMHQKMLQILERMPVELHQDLISTIWVRHYEGKRYVLDVLLHIEIESVRFMLEYLKGKSEKDIIDNLNQFILLEKKS